MAINDLLTLLRSQFSNFNTFVMKKLLYLGLGLWGLRAFYNRYIAPEIKKSQPTEQPKPADNVKTSRILEVKNEPEIAIEEYISS